MSSGKYSFKQLMKDIPKAEIHLHIEGLISVDTIWNLIQKNKLKFEGSDSKASLKKKFQTNSLEEFIDLFLNVIQASFKQEQDLIYLIEDAQDYLVRNGIVHAEIFFSPSKFLQSGFSFSYMMDILQAGSKKILEQSGITVNFLIDVSRSFGPDNAENNLDLILKNRRDSVIGIGLGGSELKGPAKDYKAVFERAIKNGLKVVAHAGEDVGPESIWDSINLLKAERIGHGISAIKDQKLMELLKEKQIPMELCPTSNLFTKKYVNDIKKHPIKSFYEQGLCVTLNSDDPTLFGSELVDEYVMLYENKIFTDDELINIAKQTLFASYLSEEQKSAIWTKAEKLIAKYKTK